jgi:hypothetical protein
MPIRCDTARRYLLLKGKLLDCLPPSARRGAEARNLMAASGKLQVPPRARRSNAPCLCMTRRVAAAQRRHVELPRPLAVGGGRHQRRVRRVLLRA